MSRRWNARAAYPLIERLDPRSAFGYAATGERHLWQETAFRHIAAACLMYLLLLTHFGVNGMDVVLLIVLFFCLVAVEALNRAIKSIVDHLAHDWQVSARDAWDLGLLAAMCLLCANAAFIAADLAGSLAEK
ncbi:diacylglycerol kinase [Ruegeria sp. XHP0148]|uniref:Diacylglycerol kinase n=1 Tax=Ruegeria aquimaris TaxID=2984333 RepID=A0ABT3AIK0_9RHOB|nr:diacylglycerol kinase [Ruegeria sp. XHP0148]